MDWDRGLINPHFSLQPRRPKKKFQKNTITSYVPAKKSPSVLQLDLYFLSCLGISGCPSENWDRGLTNPHFSLQLRRLIERSKVNMTQKTILYSMSKFFNLQIWSNFTFTCFLMTDLSFLAMGGWGAGVLRLLQANRNTNSSKFLYFSIKILHTFSLGLIIRCIKLENKIIPFC